MIASFLTTTPLKATDQTLPNGLALRHDGVYRINGSFFASNQTPYKGPGGYTAIVSQYQFHFGIWGDVALAYLKGPHYHNNAIIENFYLVDPSLLFQNLSSVMKRYPEYQHLYQDLDSGNRLFIPFTAAESTP